MHLKRISTFLYAIVLCLLSCNSGTGEYLNHTVASKEKYKSDSLLIVNKLKVELQNQEAFFECGAYAGSSQIIVDSIIYSPDYTKKAIFIVLKDRTEHQLSPDPEHEWYYDGTCYLGTGEGDSLKLYWVGPTFTQSESKERIADFIKDYYYRRYNTGDTTQPNYCKYNLDDVRFWTCPVWDDLIQRDIRKKAFEEERIKHPENVYDPKRPRY